MAKHSHLTLQERSIICARIAQGASFRQIGAELDKDPGTISKEIRLHRVSVETGSFGCGFNPCIHRRNCTKKFVCVTCIYRGKKCSLCKNCLDFIEEVCPKLLKPPYICTACKERSKCTLRKFEYHPNYADKIYQQTLGESRQGFSVTPEELERINKIVSPLIKNGQSIHHIWKNNKDILMVSEKTLYNLLNAGAFSATKLDCPRIVRMRPRQKTPAPKVDRHCYDGRTYDDFIQFMVEHPDTPVVQMDSVIGRKGGKVLLTIFFQNCNLLLAFLRDHNTASSVTDIFEDLYSRLGHDDYCKLFPVILTDRGSEFSNPTAIEKDADGHSRSRIFYCNPSAPYQKGGIEVSHELIRRILPKGTSFDSLQQEDIDLMLSHINSYKRDKLNNRSAYQLFSFIYGESILNKLNVRELQPNDIVLSPKLLRK